MASSKLLNTYIGMYLKRTCVTNRSYVPVLICYTRRTRERARGGGEGGRSCVVVHR